VWVQIPNPSLIRYVSLGKFFKSFMSQFSHLESRVMITTVQRPVRTHHVGACAMTGRVLGPYSTLGKHSLFWVFLFYPAMGDFEGRIQMIKLKGRFTCSTGTQTI
jgi:hypothetical protein